MALSDKQQVFVAEYLKCWNATEAARRANYAHPNKQGPRLLVNVGISEEIEARKAEMIMSADEAMIRLTEQARGAHGEYMTHEGKIDIARLVEDGKAYLVKNIKETKYGLILEFADTQRAIEDVLRIHGKFDSGPDGSNEKPFVVKVLKGDASMDNI